MEFKCIGFGFIFDEYEEVFYGILFGGCIGNIEIVD